MKRRIIAVGMLGNILEIYDISIYGYFSQYFAENFLSAESQANSLIYTFAIFFCGFLARPVGSIVFGKMGDKYGRRLTLSSSILLMAAATGLIAFLPTYKKIGVWAMFLLLLLRIAQGFSVGAEYTGSITFLHEHAPAQKKLYWSSFAVMAINMGTLFAAVVCWLLEIHYSHTEMQSFGWRIPYLIAFVGGIVAFYLRTKIPESPEYIASKNILPARLSVNVNMRYLMLIMMLACFGVTANYLYSVFVVTWMSNYLQFSLKSSLLINALSTSVTVICVPIFGRVIPIKNIRQGLYCAVTAIMAFSIPYQVLIHSNNIYLAILAQVCAAIPCACYFTLASYLIVNILPTNIRYSYSAVGYNVSATLFGGTTPLLCLYLMKATNLYFAPAIYVILIGLIWVFVINKLYR